MKKYKTKPRFNLSDFFCSNPYTQHGRECKSSVFHNLKDEEFSKIFFGNLYASPYFESKPFSQLSNEEIDFFRKRDAFLEKLENDEEYPLLLIRGTAGSGKSTFLAKIMEEFRNKSNKKKKYSYENYEIEKPPFIIRMGEEEDEEYGIKSTKITKSTYGLCLFEFIVFCKIVDIVTDFLDKNKKETTFKRINFEKNYKMFTEKNNRVKKKQKDVLKWIGNFCNTNNEEDISDLKEIVTEQIHGVRSNEINKSITYLLELTLMVIYCTFDLTKSKKDYYFLCLDGIEHFITPHKDPYCLYCEDIVEIMRSIGDFTRQIIAKNTIFDNAPDSFNQRFKIVVTLRDTTKRYLPLEWSNINNISDVSIDVTQWYRFNDILSKKFIFFKESIKYDNDEIKKLIEVIIEDSKAHQAGNSLVEMLEMMYNFDKRNLSKSLFSLFDDNGIQKNFREITPRDFVDFWNRGDDIKFFRYLCRRAIIRLMFNKVRTIKIDGASESGILDELFFRVRTPSDVATKYARKILLFLMAKQYNNKKISDTYIPFTDLIKGVFSAKQQKNNWDTACQQGVGNNVTNDFARVLFFMSHYSLLNSFWQQLVVLKYNDNINRTEIFLDPDANPNICISKIEEMLIDCYKSNDNGRGIKLTYTGVFLAYIQPEFSFFACRNEEDGLPLILRNNAIEICKTITNVYVDCVKCIRSIIEKDYMIFDNYFDMEKTPRVLYVNEKNMKLTHPHRIISSHIFYLNEYKNFIEKENKRVFCDKSKVMMINHIDEYLSYYKILRKQLIDGHGGEAIKKIINNEEVYFNLAADKDGAPHLKDKYGNSYGYERPVPKSDK